MMGSRGCIGGGEIDTLSHKARRLMKFRPGVVRAFKRKFWKRKRRIANRDARSEACDEHGACEPRRSMSQLRRRALPPSSLTGQLSRPNRRVTNTRKSN